MLHTMGPERGSRRSAGMPSPFLAHIEQALLHLQGGGSRTKATDIICPMYARIDEIKSFANIPMETRPVIQCEYAHAMGNSNGNYKVRALMCFCSTQLHVLGSTKLQCVGVQQSAHDTWLQA